MIASSPRTGPTRPRVRPGTIVEVPKDFLHRPAGMLKTQVKRVLAQPPA
jgi:hypothetical protein